MIRIQNADPGDLKRRKIKTDNKEGKRQRPVIRNKKYKKYNWYRK
jgi:hypothetical protein